MSLKKFGFKFAKFALLVVTLMNVYVLVIKSYPSHNSFLSTLKRNVEIDDDVDKIDWHDYKFMYYERSRVGPGENGAPFNLTDPKEIEVNKIGYDTEGIYTVVSDKISPNRSVPDIRLPVCKTRKYLRKLPPTSVIVIFVDEPWSLLLRCLHSIYNRTPHELLLEIVLVNDKSNNETLGELIEKYARANFGDKVRYFANPERKGLIVTRMEGARKAKGEVIVFLDSHMEVNVNWLPPLIEPIALSPITAAVPIIDSFSPYTLEYQKLGHGSRGSFDWSLTYQWLLLTTEYQKEPGDNYQLSAMTGGAYAINRENFFRLGGYDEGMMVWNGENYELSFKLHLCGGNLIQVPCSHVAHTTKHRTPYRNEKYGVDYSARNLKRVAEVWMDEYKDALYQTDPERYKIDPGNLTKAFELKKRLNCKPFKYFVEVIAPDLAERFPPFEHPHFASGAVYPDSNSSFCITFIGPGANEPLKLTECSINRKNPLPNQAFAMAWQRFISYHTDKTHIICLDAVQTEAVNMFGCHWDFGNQLWKYDVGTHQIINLPKDMCLTTVPGQLNLFMRKCNETDFNQKFSWGNVNLKALANWETEGRVIKMSKNP